VVNFIRSFRFLCAIFSIVQIFVLNSRIEANQEIFLSIEQNIDAESIIQCDNIEKQIDTLIDLAFKYQEITSKKFNHKKHLKKTYSYLEENGIKVDKTSRKDIKKCIENRISDRYFSNKISNHCCLVVSVNTDPNFRKSSKSYGAARQNFLRTYKLKDMRLL
jgi:hypothetical protein